MDPDPIPDDPTLGMHIWGWMSQRELKWLGAAAKKMASVAEVGCLHGRSAFMLLSKCSGPVYCIDPWDDREDLCYGSFMAHCGHFKNLHVVRGYSPAAAAEVPKVDMVFLDGDHSYEAVMADIGAWLPKTGKLICGHDYQNEDGGYPGVAQAVNEVFGKQVKNPADTAIWAVSI